MKQIIYKSLFRFCTTALLFFVVSIYIIAQQGPGKRFPQFLFPEFAKSIVKLKTGKQANLILNYNTVTEKMIFLQGGVVYDMVNIQSVDTIYLLDCTFVPVDSSFYELLVNGDYPFYIQHKSDVSFKAKPSAEMTTQVSESNYHPITTASVVYLNQELPPEYSIKDNSVYWIKANNKMSRFSSARQLIKKFPEKKDQITQFIKGSKLDINNRPDLIKLGNYCNGLLK